jgi:cell division protein FtsI (penicillin-binding protein 3)
VGALYEPGSVFKIVTLSGAINEHLARADELVDCQMGSIYVAGHKIRDHKPFGMLTVAQILAKSSDVGAIKLGLRLGPSKFYEYIRAFGFGQSTGVDLPGENKGMLRRPENWGSFSIGSISMGQEVGVTAMQLISAMNTIANGGQWVRPHVVRGMKRSGAIDATVVPPPRRVISESTAATMRSMLEGVVLPGGTAARLGALSGYTAGGKTGTAQRYDPATGRYSASQYVASFVGFAPINEPAITVLVTLDSPVGAHQGGEVSAPIFKKVAEEVLAYLNVPQDEPVSPKLQQASYSAKSAANDADSSDFDPSQTEDESNASPLMETPPPAAPDAPAPTVAISEGDAVSVPQLAGKSVRDAASELAGLGLTPVLIGTGVAVEESPEAGATVRRGSRIAVRFGNAEASGKTAAQAKAATQAKTTSQAKTSSRTKHVTHAAGARHAALRNASQGQR